MLKLNILKSKNTSGITLIELLIAMGVFSIMMLTFYTSFESTSQNVSDLAVKQEMTQKGQRVLDYIGEQLRLAGLFVAATPNVNFCPNISSFAPSVQSITMSMVATDANPYETISFLTSERLITSTQGSPYLQTTLPAGQTSTILTVNAPIGSAGAIIPASVGSPNANSLITLDTLQPNLGNLVYQVTPASGGSNLTISPALNQNVNAHSNLYAVVMKQISVDTNRDLILTRWDNLASGPCNTSSVSLVSSSGPNFANGGVDGFAVEFVLANEAPITQKSVIQSTDIANIKEIIIWILLRSDFPASNKYVNSNTYTFGQQTQIVLPAFNDNYRRLLLSKSVEVKNVGF